mgnify:CR=1 FL=1
MSQFTDTLKSLVAQHKVKVTLAILADFLNGKDRDMYNQCVMYQSTLLKTEHDSNLSLISRNDAEQSLSKIKFGLLSLIDDCEHLVVRDEPPALRRGQEVFESFREKEFDPPASRSAGPQMMLLGVALLLVLAVGTGIWFWQKAQNSATLPGTTTASKIAVPIDTAVAVAALYNEADNYYQQMKFEKALVPLNKALALRPEAPKMLNFRAELYLQLNRLPEALADGKRAVFLDPDLCFAFVTLAQIESKLANPQKFYEYLELALQKHCEVWDFTNQPGLVEHQNEKRFQALLKAYRQ